MLGKPGDGAIVDDPRGVALALGRRLGTPSSEPVAPIPVGPRAAGRLPTDAQRIATLRDAGDWNRVADTDEARAASGRRIRARAIAAEQLLESGASPGEAFAALGEGVRNRSLHRDWRFHGPDGAMAARTLRWLRAPDAVEAARFVLWRDDPALDPVVDPRWKNPRAWADFRVKMVVLPALEHGPGPAAESRCRDYLALGDEDATRIGPPLERNKPFTLMPYPNRAHSVSEGRNTTRHLYGLLTPYLTDHRPAGPRP